MWIRNLNASWVRGGVCSVSWLDIVLLFNSSCVHLCSPVSCWLISLVLAVCVLPCRLVSHGLFSGFCSSCFPGLIVTFWFGGCVSWFVRCLAFVFQLLYLSFSSDQSCSRLPPEGLAFGSPLSATHHTPLPRGVHPSAFEGFCPAYMMVTFWREQSLVWLLAETIRPHAMDTLFKLQ